MHTMVRVGNLEKSIDFYQDVLEMKLIKKMNFPEGKFTLAYLGYGTFEEDTLLELTWNWDVETYELGSGYGHIAIEVDDAYRVCEIVKKRGGKVVREAGPMKGSSFVIAFLEDPDGYKVELIEKKKI